MNSILRGDEFTEEIKKDFVEEERKDLLRIVDEQFIDEDLKNKFIFEASAKNKILENIDWEISTKTYDSVLKDRASGLKTCLLKLTTYKKDDLRNSYKSSSILELRKKDVEELIEILKKVRGML